MKTKQTVVCGLLAVLFALAFTACDSGTTRTTGTTGGSDGQPGDSTHTHQWGVWTVTTAATCAAVGVETRTCSLDTSHRETREISINPNAHNYEMYPIIIATSITDGSEIGVCQNNPLHTSEPRTVYAWGTEGLAFEAIGSPATAYRVRKGTVTNTTVTIPAVYRPNSNSAYLPVTEIGSTSDIPSGGAFNGTAITKITIPDSVTSIGSYAFYNCSSLNDINNDSPGDPKFPANLKSIGNSAFDSCFALPTTITLNAGLTSIGDGAFKGCTSVETIKIPGSVTSISSYAFVDCSSLKTIELNAGLTSIGSYAFSGCSSLKNIKPLTTTTTQLISGFSTLTSINDSAFKGCTTVTEIFIPISVTTIGPNAFDGWDSNNQTINVPFQAINDKPSGWNASWLGTPPFTNIKYWSGSAYVSPPSSP